jgi:DNA polymerase elongation subunit (family B)
MSYEKIEDNIRDNVMDHEDFMNIDIKINPDFYIHNAIIKAQNCLMENNIKEGFLKFRVFIEQIEVLCRSAKILDDDYDQEIIKYVKEEEEKEKNSNKVVDPVIFQSKLANYKLGRLMARVFDRKSINTELSYTKYD